MDRNVKLISSQAQLKQVWNLRRRVLGKYYLDDNLDGFSWVWIYELAGEIVGSMRIARLSDGPFEDADKLHLGVWTKFYTHEQIAQASRLVVEPRHQGKRIAHTMIARAYEDVMAASVRLIFVDVRPNLLSFYTKFGFEDFREPYLHDILQAEYLPLVWLLDRKPRSNFASESVDPWCPKPPVSFHSPG